MKVFVAFIDCRTGDCLHFAAETSDALEAKILRWLKQNWDSDLYGAEPSTYDEAFGKFFDDTDNYLYRDEVDTNPEVP